MTFIGSPIEHARTTCRQIKIIERAFGDLPVAALGDRRTRGIFTEWRDKLAKSSRRQADYAWAVLARALA